jgi:hypothetical protein
MLGILILSHSHDSLNLLINHPVFATVKNLRNPYCSLRNSPPRVVADVDTTATITLIPPILKEEQDTDNRTEQYDRRIISLRSEQTIGVLSVVRRLQYHWCYDHSLPPQSSMTW